MAMICDICGSHASAGGSHKHHRGVAGGQWKRRAQHTIRTVRPNIHRVTLLVNGILTRMRVCANCIKRVKFDNRKRQIAPALATA